MVDRDVCIMIRQTHPDPIPMVQDVPAQFASGECDLGDTPDMCLPDSADSMAEAGGILDDSDSTMPDRPAHVACAMPTSDIDALDHSESDADDEAASVMHSDEDGQETLPVCDIDSDLDDQSPDYDHEQEVRAEFENPFDIDPVDEAYLSADAPSQTTAETAHTNMESVLQAVLACVSSLGFPLRYVANKILSRFPTIVARLTGFKYFVLLLMLKWVIRFNISASAASAIFRVVSCMWTFFTATAFPHNFARACQELNVTGDFKHAAYYVTCPECGGLTPIAQAADHTTGTLQGARCRQTPHCKGILMQKIVTANGRTRWVVPTSRRLIYPGVLKQIEKILARPSIRDALCWYLKRPKLRDGVLIDIWDGLSFRDWQTVVKPNGVQNWFSSDVTPDLFLQFNGDSFNPFSSGQYSVCALYLTLANLPREVRFLEENTILVCLVPGTFVNMF